jgi:tetratricopeptide (TPR) repeat protein
MNKFILTIAFTFLLAIISNAQVYNDATLAKVREMDKQNRDTSGKLMTLTSAEHAYRADVYSSNRVFPSAREHWEKILKEFSNDSVTMPKALFGIARSYMWEREYGLAITFFDDLLKSYQYTKDGREGLAFKGACLVRLGLNAEAAKVYQQYIQLFPTGERIENAYLNTIDALREAGKYDEAEVWVNNTRLRFSGLPTETNALFAKLRMDIYRGKFDKAVATADELNRLNDFDGSMTNFNETRYLKAFSLEKLGRKNDAISVYTSIADSPISYYGNLSTQKLLNLSPTVSMSRSSKVSVDAKKLVKDFPAPYRTELLKHTKSRGIDPRFVLAIMKQESSFRANAKSQSAARGLLQLVYDTALKYNKQAGYPNLLPEDLYKPEVNIAIASIYIAELKKQFSGLYEPICASYNGGEDNALRWLNRSKPKENAIFTSEIGFSESKNYVFKVMGNYRVYRELYTEDLRRK